MVNLPPDSTTRPIPLSVALLNRRSVGGAIVVALAALFFILVLPSIDAAVKERDLTVGERVAVGEYVSVTPGPGWALKPESGDSFTTLTNSGAQLVVMPASPATNDTAAQIAAVAKDLADDPDTSWVVAPPTTFVTSTGDAGAMVTAQSKAAATQVWIVGGDDWQTTIVLTSPIAVWDTIASSANAMAESVTFREPELP